MTRPPPHADVPPPPSENSHRSPVLGASHHDQSQPSLGASSSTIGRAAPGSAEGHRSQPPRTTTGRGARAGAPVAVAATGPPDPASVGVRMLSPPTGSAAPASPRWCLQRQEGSSAPGAFSLGASNPTIRTLARREADQEEVAQRTWLRLLEHIESVGEPAELGGGLPSRAAASMRASPGHESQKPERTTRPTHRDVRALRRSARRATRRHLVAREGS